MSGAGALRGAVPLRGSGLRRRAAQPSPDGTRILFASSGIYTVGADGRDRRKLAGDANAPFAWSPDGQSVAYAACGSKFCSYISVVPASGGPARRLTTKPRFII